MVKFAFETLDINFPDWSKHHKALGAHVRRVYEDGEIVEAKTENVRELVAKHEDKLKSKHVTLFDRKEDKRRDATDYFLPVYNQEYAEANLEHYSVGASNTKQTTHMRLKFMIEDNLFILGHEFKSSGHYATSFYDVITNSDFIEDIIAETLETGKPIEEIGIAKGDDGGYHIVVANSASQPDDFEIEKRELINSLVAVEVYKHDMEIVDDKPGK